MGRAIKKSGGVQFPKKANEAGNYTNKKGTSEGEVPAGASVIVKIDRAAQTLSKSHHILPRSGRSSGIHFHSSDSLSRTNLIFVCQLQAK